MKPDYENIDLSIAGPNEHVKLVEVKTGTLDDVGPRRFEGEMRFEKGKIIIINCGKSDLTINNIKIKTS